MPRRILQGVVITATNDKTIVVKVERRVRHPLYKKTIKKTNNFHAHDEKNICKVVDQVRIIECRPISKKKSWSLLQESK